MAGILSGQWLWMHQDRRLHKKPFVVVILELSLCSVQDGKSGSCWEPSSRVELHENFLAKVSFVSRCCQDLWAIKKRSRLPPVKNAVANPPEVTRFDKLRYNRATSCFGIIGPHIFEDSLTVITRITKQFLIFRSCILMVLMEVMVAMCNGSGTRCEPW